MIEIVKAIKAKDWHSLQEAVARLVDSPNLSVNALQGILETFPSIVAAFPDQSIVEHQDHNIVWHRYETLIWEIGETFRQIFKKHEQLRKEPNLLRELEQVALNTQFGKGRESFVMLLGRYGNQDVINTLKSLLEDREVQGHAIYALRLIGASEVQDDIRPFLQSSKTWVRNEAKKYFVKLEKQQMNFAH